MTANATHALTRRPTPGHSVVTLAIALALSAGVTEVVINDRLGGFFDFCFVAICAWVGVRVQRRDFYIAALMPPCLMLGLITLLATTSKVTVAQADDSGPQALVSGMAHHSVALALGYLVCLGCLAVRLRNEALANDPHR